MKFLSTAIICAIVCATSVTAVENQEQQQGSQKPCNERNEQECKEPECISTVKYVHGVGERFDGCYKVLTPEDLKDAPYGPIMVGHP